MGRGVRRGLAVCGVFGVVWSTPARADDEAARAADGGAASAQVEARLRSAHLDSPVSALVWRGQLRGKLGIVIPLASDDLHEGTFVQVAALIELHNDQAAFVPYQYWRGRLSVEGATARPCAAERLRSRSVSLSSTKVTTRPRSPSDS